MHHMRDPRLAEAYCDRMYDTEAAKQNGKRGQRRASWSAPPRQLSYEMYLSLIQAESSILIFFYIASLCAYLSP